MDAFVFKCPRTEDQPGASGFDTVSTVNATLMAEEDGQESAFSTCQEGENEQGDGEMAPDEMESNKLELSLSELELERERDRQW